MSIQNKLRILLLTWVGLAIGCGKSAPPFESNRLLLHRVSVENEASMDSVASDLKILLEEQFGSPDEPRWPEVLKGEEFSPLDRPELLERGAGPVGRAHDKVERGLFRKHCAHCHSLTGDGLGPTAYFQNPYPRDFRRGTFKFKSTPIGAKPTMADLRRVLERGIMGTAMPAFHTLVEERKPSELAPRDEQKDAPESESAEKPEGHKQMPSDDLDVLTHYVRYLAIRGEVERKILLKAGSQLNLEAKERLYDPSLRTSDPQVFTERFAWIEKTMKEVAQGWLIADQKTIVVPEDPLGRSESKSSDGAMLKESIARGRELFQGATAACAQCHGREGEGDGATPDFDEWTKDWTIRAGIDPKEKKSWKPMKKLGALAPRRDLPRNFRLGVFRGGEDPSDIYRRIAGGIDGSPMPAVPLSPAHPQGFTPEQIWDLVHFVQSLSSETSTSRGAN